MPAKLDMAGFVAKARSKHGDKYDYSAVTWRLSTDKITVICPQHGAFQQRASNHLLGRGCPACKSTASSTRQILGRDEFIAKAREAHGDAYDYSRVVYERTNKPVEIICRVHGPFWQKPNAHTSRKNGCPRCAGKGLTTAGFISELRAVHGSKFNYDRVVYKGIKKHITVTCEKHGEFSTPAESHRKGAGCTRCWLESYSSAAEREIADWIENIGFPVKRATRDVISPLEIDIYIPSRRIGIEFNGRYWHSDKVNKNARQHEYKWNAAQRAGIRLITVWDIEWETKQSLWRRHLLHALGADQSLRVDARSCHVTPVTSSEAAAFYQTNHLQGACRSATTHLALRIDGAVVACMSFAKGAARRGSGEWELARYATSCIVRGGASRLLRAFLRSNNPQTIWSFSDNQTFGGALYERLGFTADAKIRADYRLVMPNGSRTWHKSLWKRRCIPARLRELGIDDPFDPLTDPRTERQVQDMVGVLRIWDAGKTRWVWRDQ